MTKEPLSNLARFAFDWADTLCDPDHGCREYHKMWSVVRLVENNGALPAGSDFFRREIAAVSIGGKVHVLVSGGADAGLMALAIQGAKSEGLDIRITAIDRCRTPLNQMLLYGAASGIQTNIVQDTIDRLSVDGTVDAILGHSILPFIPAQLRVNVFMAWKAALRPGGRILLSQPFGRDFMPIDRTWTPEQLERHKGIIEEKLAVSGLWATIGSREAILDAAIEFWRAPAMPRAKVTEDELRICAAQVGLTVLKCDAAPISPSCSPSPFAKKAQTSPSPRYEIVLEKPLD